MGAVPIRRSALQSQNTILLHGAAHPQRTRYCRIWRRRHNATRRFCKMRIMKRKRKKRSRKFPDFSGFELTTLRLRVWCAVQLGKTSYEMMLLPQTGRISSTYAMDSLGLVRQVRPRCAAAACRQPAQVSTRTRWSRAGANLPG